MLRPVSLLAALALALAGCSPGGGGDTRPPLKGAKIGGDFALVDKAGKPVRFHDFAGKYRVVYFGYSFCPDVCPLDMQKIAKGYALFAKDEPQVAERVQPIFVTIDPARDGPKEVGDFAAAFSPKVIGLTGTEQQVAEAAKMFAVYRKKGEVTANGGYMMDHSSQAFLFDPDGKPLALLPVDLPPDQAPKAIAETLAKWTS